MLSRRHGFRRAKSSRNGNYRRTGNNATRNLCRGDFVPGFCRKLGLVHSVAHHGNQEWGGAHPSRGRYCRGLNSAGRVRRISEQIESLAEGAGSRAQSRMKNKRMILLLDNYDSFTYNLAQYLGDLGCDVELHRNDKISVEEIARRRPERIVISPGPCTPQEAGISVELIQRLAGKFAILGVCLGHQAMGAAYGGKIVRAPKLFHGKTSQIEHDGKGVFRGLPQKFTATRYHSLIVEKKSLPREFTITAETADGTIMGMRHKKHKMEGVQFHPESVLTESGKQLLRNFLEL